MQILIVDPVTPKPYSSATLLHEPLGGTEATVIRIAEYMDAVVIQHNRTRNEGRFRTDASPNDPSHVIVLREPLAALQIAERYPKASKFLWLHDLASAGTDRGNKLLVNAPQLASEGVTLVCVSEFHAKQVRENFSLLPEHQRPKVVRIYNPVSVLSYNIERTPYDPDKLVFFSSPHKGLEYTLHVFSHMRTKNRNLRLYIANPGYLPSLAREWPGVVNLGAISHRAIIEHVGSALCTFYPNYVYPETFGLALAESNAMQTPVLTHAIGAASEVLLGDDQTIEIPRIRGLADSFFWRFPASRQIGESALGMLGFSKSYEKRIRSWQSGKRPAVAGRPEFSIESVAASWKKVLS